MYICKMFSKGFFTRHFEAKLYNKCESAMIPVHKLDELKFFLIKHELILYT
jgi:hypothetical protein